MANVKWMNCYYIGWLVFLFLILASEASYVFLVREDQPNYFPDNGNTWFNKPKPRAPRGPPIGKAFVPDKKSPLKVLDAEIASEPFNPFSGPATTETPMMFMPLAANSNEKTVTRSSDITDPRLAHNVNGDTYYGLKLSDTTSTGVSEQIMHPEEFGIKFHQVPATGEAVPEDDAPTDHVDEETHISEQPLQHTATINKDYSQSYTENEVHPEDSEKEVHVMEHHVDNVAVNLESPPQSHKFISGKDEEDLSNNEVQNDVPETVPPDNGEIKEEHPGNVESLPPVNIINEKPPPIHIRPDGPMPHGALKGPMHTGIPESDAITSENEALNLGKQFGDAYSEPGTDLQETSRDVQHNGHDLNELVIPEHLKAPHKHPSHVRQHHRITIDTETGEIVHEDTVITEHSGKGPGTKSHHSHSEHFTPHESDIAQSRHHLKTSRKMDMDIPQKFKSRYQQHRHANNHIGNEDAVTADQKNKEIDEFNTLQAVGNDIESTKGHHHKLFDMKKNIDASVADADDVIQSKESGLNIKEETLNNHKAISHKLQVDPISEESLKYPDHLHAAFNKLGDSTAETINNDLDYFRFVAKARQKHLHLSPPDVNLDHAHEDETFDNNDITIENTQMESPKRHSHTNRGKPLFALEPKIEKPHEVIEPSYMLHGDPRGDGLGTGVVDGPEISSSANTTSEESLLSNGGMKRQKLNNTAATDSSKENDRTTNSSTEENKETDKTVSTEGYKQIPQKVVSNIGNSQDEINVEIDTGDLFQNIFKNSLHDGSEITNKPNKFHNKAVIGNLINNDKTQAKNGKESTSSFADDNDDFSTNPAKSKKKYSFSDESILNSKALQKLAANVLRNNTKENILITNKNNEHLNENKETKNKFSLSDRDHKLEDQNSEETSQTTDDATQTKSRDHKLEDQNSEETSQTTDDDTQTKSRDHKLEDQNSEEMSRTTDDNQTKSKLLTNIQEHLKGIELEDLSRIQEEIRQLKTNKMYMKNPANSATGLSRSSPLDLDVKSTEFRIPDHQLTLPITNPGHPDETNGIPKSPNTKIRSKTEVMPLLNPRPTKTSGFLNVRATSRHSLRHQSIRNENGYAKNSIARKLITQHTVKVTGKENEFELEPFVVASKVSTISQNNFDNPEKETAAKSVDVTGKTRTMPDKIPTYKPDVAPVTILNTIHFADQKLDNSTFDIGDTPNLEHFHGKPTPAGKSKANRTSKRMIVPIQKSYRKKMRTHSRYFMKKSKLSEEDMDYNTKQSFIKQLVRDADKPKQRKRVLSFKRSAERNFYRRSAG